MVAMIEYRKRDEIEKKKKWRKKDKENNTITKGRKN